MKTKLKRFALGFLGMFSFLTLGFGNLALAQGGGFAPAGFGVNAQETQGTGVIGEGEDRQRSLIDVIKNAVNWILGMLSLITLVILLWGGFQMVTAAGDEGKYKKGFTILKQAGIGLAFIALAWLFVSLIFWLLGGITSTGA